MALRRLFSGWLIAMAALARSVAQVLERASEDRSASAPDPVMAAMAERYPGAPAHWLAHVAERASQLAEVGQAPLSLNSDPAVWSTMRPDGPPLRLERSEAREEQEPVPREPRRPLSPRRDAEIPTLAALRDRSSEVWRRPEPEQRRRPRPVFAALDAAPSSDRPVGPAPVQDLARRPRSPLSFAGSSAKASSDAPSPAAPLSEAPTPRAGRTELASTLSEVRKPAEGASTDRYASRTPSNDVSERPKADRAEAIEAPPAARRQRAWFFAKSTPAGGRHPLELWAYPASGRARGLETDATDVTPASHPASPYSMTVQRAAAQEPVWRALTPPAQRRSIFQTLAALRSRLRSRADRPWAPERAPAEPAPSTDQPSLEPRPGRPTPAFTRSSAGRSARSASVFSLIDPDASPRPMEDSKSSRVLGEPVRRAPSRPAARGETRLHDKRSAFASPRPSPPRAAPRRFVDLSTDDRWPPLPPPTVTSPIGVAAPPPRFEELAREQEEGRWSV